MNDASQISRYLLKRWEAGDQSAATAIYARYISRLVRLVAAQYVAGPVRAKFGAEDVAHSAIREILDKISQQKIVLKRSGALWALLATTAINKLKGQIEFHTAQKRSPFREQQLEGDAQRLFDREPSNEEAAAVMDELAAFLHELSETDVTILSLRLEGLSFERIAKTVGRSEAAVKSVLEHLEKQLRARLYGS
jgi:RNA polymerase sigma factor (sigma-70 family)